MTAVPTPTRCETCGRDHAVSVPSGGRMTLAYVATWPLGPVLGPFALKSDAEAALAGAGMLGIGSVMSTYTPAAGAS